MVLDQDTLASAIAWRRRDRQLPTWRGVQCQQFPADLWRYGELCFQLEPPFVVEVGSGHGGTALFLADVLALIGNGHVVAVDVNPVPVTHPRVIPLVGDSLSTAVLDQVAGVAGARRGLVLLDGDHDPVQVAQELDRYAPLADYLVVEDTIMAWLPEYGGSGPLDALHDWLPDHPEFTADPDPIPGPTQHPGGWLRRRP